MREIHWFAVTYLEFQNSPEFEHYLMIVYFLTTDFTDEAVFSLTTKGRSKLVHLGFEYTKNFTNSSGTHWRCVRSRRHSCKGKAITKQIGHMNVVSAYHTHNHEPTENVKTTTGRRKISEEPLKGYHYKPEQNTNV